MFFVASQHLADGTDCKRSEIEKKGRFAGCPKSLLLLLTFVSFSNAGFRDDQDAIGAQDFIPTENAGPPNLVYDIILARLDRYQKRSGQR